MPVAQKTQTGFIDGTPVKRMFWSIISDYDLKTSVCELVDNALDLWTSNGRPRPLAVDVVLEAQRQLIVITDDAGGIKEEELRLLVVPGGSKNSPQAVLIGIFGVGGKRACIALGEHVEIKTRFKRDKTFQLDITKDWLEIDQWEIPVYTTGNIEPGTTSVAISRLRKPFTQENVEEIRSHAGETYAWFLHNGCTIRLNGASVAPKDYDTWAYPLGHPPHTAQFDIMLENDRIEVEVTAGLITDRDPEQENYGVYVYCNDRLIVKDYKTRDVGYFVTGEAGVPHPDASLCRAIVRLKGPARHMPWNSSKNDINTGHAVFQYLRPSLINLVSHFSSLSRRLKNEWGEKVLPHKKGTIKRIAIADIAAGKNLHLPELPPGNKRQVEQLKARNKKILQNMPWVIGLVESMAAVDVITRQRLDTKNRIALILLDSNFEIAIKEFIVSRTDLFPAHTYTDAKISQLFQRRTDVISEVVSKITISSTTLSKARHYYTLRNKLIHERATVGITDADVETYRKTIQDVLNILFKLKFEA